jgi:hypothetical protein
VENISRQVRRAAQRATRKAKKNAVAIPPNSGKIRQGLGAFLGAGATSGILALFLGSLAQAGILNMANAYAMLGAAWLIGTVAFCVSEWIWQFPAEHRAIIGASASVLFGIILILSACYEREANYELTHVVADNQPTPTSSCMNIDRHTFLVFLGDNSVVARESKFPFTIIEMGRDRNNNPLPLLVIDKNDRGISIKTLRIFGIDDKLGTKIDSDAWIDNSNFHSTKINPHQLIVRDDQDQEVLNVYYLNERAIKITGVFRHPRMYPFEITPTEFRYNKSHYFFGCLIAPNARSAYFIDGPGL